MSPQQKKHGQPSTILRRNPGTGARRRWLLGPQRDARAVHGARLGAGNRAGRGPDRAAPGPGPGAPQLEAPLVAAEAQRQPFRAAVFGSAERRAGVDRPCCLPRLRRAAGRRRPPVLPAPAPPRGPQILHHRPRIGVSTAGVRLQGLVHDLPKPLSGRRVMRGRRRGCPRGCRPGRPRG